jgi:hypothetical protein
MEDSDDEVIDLTGKDEVQFERRRRSFRLMNRNKNVFRSPPTASTAAAIVHRTVTTIPRNSIKLNCNNCQLIAINN